MQALLNDLVDFNRTKLGLGIKVVRSEVDLAVPVTDELEQLRGAHPQRRIELTVTGDCCGAWDGLRLQQALRNLVSNAIRYGAPDTPVRVALRGEDAEIRVEVTNSGASIDASALSEIFDPVKRGADRGDRDDGSSLGLGLFIVREIVRGHGGTVARLRTAPLDHPAPPVGPGGHGCRLFCRTACFCLCHIASTCPSHCAQWNSTNRRCIMCRQNQIRQMRIAARIALSALARKGRPCGYFRITDGMMASKWLGS